MDVQSRMEELDGEDGLPGQPVGEEVSIQLSLRKRELIDRLMIEFYATFDPNSGVITYGGSSSPIPQQNAGTNQSVNTSCLGGGNGKRKASDKDSPTRDNNGEDLNKRLRPSHDDPDVGSDMPKKLACPYFKRNPRKYQRFRSCPGPGWDTVHRLK